MASIGMWARYLRHVPVRKVFGRGLHELRIRTVVVPWSLEPRQEVALRFDGIHGFARQYVVLGERYKDASLMYAGTFSSRGTTVEFGSVRQVTWTSSPATQTAHPQWHHDLASFSYLLPLSNTDPIKTLELAAELCESVDRTAPPALGRRPAFAQSPLALSLRIMALTCVLEAAQPDKGAPSFPAAAGVTRHIQRSERMLQWTLERHLGYNHTVFAHAALSVARTLRFGRPGAHARDFLDEVRRYLLPDGFWAERSPTYHIHVLFLVRAILGLCDHELHVRQGLEDVAKRMTAALGVVTHPDGEIATFNDASIGDAVSPSEVGWKRPRLDESKQVLPHAGFARMWNRDYCVIMDAGPMGPNDVIGHGHADFLSLEVAVGGARLIVDPGVASVAAGAARVWTRSAQWHNGPTLEGAEPAEFFGAWRVGFRGTAWFEDGGVDAELVGACDGYKALAGVVRRQVRLSPSRITWTDSFERPPSLRAFARFIFDGSWNVSPESPTSLRIQHQTRNLALRFASQDAVVTSCSNDFYYPYGPALAKSATFVRFAMEKCEATYCLEIDEGM